jgi:hypothetical protein
MGGSQSSEIQQNAVQLLGSILTRVIDTSNISSHPPAVAEHSHKPAEPTPASFESKRDERREFAKGQRATDLTESFLAKIHEIESRIQKDLEEKMKKKYSTKDIYTIQEFIRQTLFPLKCTHRHDSARSSEDKTSVDTEERVSEAPLIKEMCMTRVTKSGSEKIECEEDTESDIPTGLEDDDIRVVILSAFMNALRKEGLH